MKLDVFAYSSYSHYMSDWHHLRQSTDKSWTLGRFSKAVGLGNTAAITNIIKGRKIPSQETLRKVAVTLDLNQREQMYFETLVELSRNEKNNLIGTSLRRMISYVKPKIDQREISKQTFSFISKPLFFVLREMVKLKDFEFNMHTIKQRLNIEASEAEIQKAYETLIKVGLLNFDQGKFSQSVDFYETTTNIPSENIRKYHKECLIQSAAMIDTVDVKERHITSDTIVLNKADLEKLKNLIEMFRKEITQLDRDEGEVVYQFNAQLMPLTKTSP